MVLGVRVLRSYPPTHPLRMPQRLGRVRRSPDCETRNPPEGGTRELAESLPGLPDYAERSALYGAFVPTYRDPELSLRMLEGIQLTSPLRVLDLGAGQGDGSRHMRANGCDVTYADASKQVLDAGVRRGLIPPDCSVLTDISALSLPFPAQTCDVVTIRYTFHDVPNQVALLNDVRHVLMDRGMLQVVDRSSAMPDALPFLRRLHALKSKRAPKKPHIWHELGLRRLARRSRYAVIDLRWYRSYVPSGHWLRQNQIGPDRHRQITQTALSWRATNPRAARDLGRRIYQNSLSIAFPVAILTLRPEIQHGRNRI